MYENTRVNVIIVNDFCNCINIKRKDVQRKNVANNVDMSYLRAPRQNGQYTNKHTEQH